MISDDRCTTRIMAVVKDAPPELRAPEPTDRAAYVLSEYDAAMITGMRHGAGVINSNPANAGGSYPALVVGTWSATTANLRVVLDGTDDYWVTSRRRGRAPGQWYLEGDPA